MNITGGTIGYERVVKDDDYGINRKAKCELSFQLAESDELSSSADVVKEACVDKVNQMLRVKPAPKPDAAPAIPARVSPPAAAQEPAASAPKDKTKADLEAEMLAKAGAEKPKRAKKAPESVVEAQPPISTGEPRVSEEDAMAELLGEAAEPEKPIPTEVEMNNAVQKKVAQLKTPAKVIELKRKYVGAAAINTIPKERRVEFLEELNALS